MDLTPRTFYVAGFLIDPDTESVALVRKKRPDWQAGRLNGIGGHIEGLEGPHAAMSREFKEEAGVGIPVQDWHHFATVQGRWGAVYFFRSFGPFDGVSAQTDEPIEIHDIDSLDYGEDTLPNLSWLIPLARYTHDTYRPVVAEEVS